MPIFSLLLKKPSTIEIYSLIKVPDCICLIKASWIYSFLAKTTKPEVNTNLISRQALHSYKISFVHPIMKQNVTFQTDITKDLKKLTYRIKIKFNARR